MELIKIQANVYLIFTFLFYLIGVLGVAPIGDVINVVCFVLFSFLAFLIKTPFSDFISCRVSREYESFDFKIVLNSIFLFLILFFLVIYSRDGIPVFSSNVEVARMQLVNDFGVLYRVGTQFLFYIPPLLVYGFYCRYFSVGWFFVLWIVFFCLLFSMGFRSRLVDYILLTGISGYVFFGAKYNLSFAKKAIAAFCVSIFLVCAFFLISWLTAVREGFDSIGEAVDSVIYRAFYLNYIVNFERVYMYVDEVGFLYGKTFFTDFFSLFGDYYLSMQVEVTQHFNKVNSDLFIMTPTVYGEFFLNFGYWCVAMALPVFYVYRIICEYSVYLVSRVPFFGVLAIPMIINFIYYFPRQVVTGGISNAFLIRVLSIFIASFLLYVLVLIVRLLSGKVVIR